jgi:hypothetical protein
MVIREEAYGFRIRKKEENAEECQGSEGSGR